MCLNEPAVNQNSLAIEWCILCVNQYDAFSQSYSQQSLSRNTRNWNWMVYSLVACVCSWCWYLGWGCKCYRLNLNEGVDTNKWSSIHIRVKNIESKFVTSADGMNNYDAVRFGISVWTGIIESLIKVVWCLQKKLTHLTNTHTHTHTHTHKVFNEMV